MKNSEFKILELIFRWRKILLIVFVSSAVLSVIFTGQKFIKPLFKSSAVVYPANIFAYSEETNTEQMIQVLLSDDLKRNLIDSLNLFKHYRIDKDERYAFTKVFKKFDKRVKIKPTQYGSIKIDVLDRSPKFAYSLINAIIDEYNKLNLDINRKRANEILVIKEEQYLDKKQEVDSLSALVDSLIKVSQLMEYNLLKQSMYGSFSYLQSKPNNPTSLALSEISFKLFYNQTMLESEIKEMVERKSNYEFALSDTQKILDFANIISAPKISEKKVFPIRSLICFITIVSTLLFAVVIIVIVEQSQKLNHED